MLDLGAPGASCGRFSITYSRLRFLKRLIMTPFSHARKKYNRWCLLSLENNSRHTNDGAKTLMIKKLKYVYTLLYPSNTLFIWFRLIVPKESKTLWLVLVRQNPGKASRNPKSGPVNPEVKQMCNYH